MFILGISGPRAIKVRHKLKTEQDSWEVWQLRGLKTARKMVLRGRLEKSNFLTRKFK